MNAGNDKTMINRKKPVQTSRWTKTTLRSIDVKILRWMLILRPAVVTATLGLPIFLLDIMGFSPEVAINTFPVAIIVFGTYLLTLLYSIAHKFTGINRALLATEIWFDIFIITVIINYTGGISSSFVGLYLVSIMCASLFFRRLITFLFATQAVVFYVIYIVLELTFLGPYAEMEVVPSAVKYNVTMQAFMYTVVMYAVAFMSSTYAERMYKKDSALISALRLLKEARLDTSDILQSMTNGLVAVNMSGYIVYINNAAKKILQINTVETQGKQYHDIFHGRLEPMSDFIESELKHPVEMIDNEFMVQNIDGNDIPLGLSSVPLYDIDRSRRGIIVNFKDLTEKKKLMEMIRQADRMAAIGELSAAIAHEIRNPLGSICNASELIMESYTDTDPYMTKLVKIIEKESERLQRISSEFLEFARAKEPTVRVLNLHETIDEILTLLENDPRKGNEITIMNELDTSLTVAFDEDHLKQLLINIIINSLDALDGKGKIVVATQDVPALKRNYIRLVIYDDGPGFPESTLGKVFEPFFSTKKEGTGLGLALVRKLVIANNGRVLARNKVSGGAEIALDLPVTGAEA